MSCAMTPLKAFGVLLFHFLVIFFFFGVCSCNKTLERTKYPGRPHPGCWSKSSAESLPSFSICCGISGLGAGSPFLLLPYPLTFPELPSKCGEAPLPTHQPQWVAPKGLSGADSLSSTWLLPKLVPFATPRIIPPALCSRNSQAPDKKAKGAPGGPAGSQPALLRGDHQKPDLLQKQSFQ